MKKTPFLLTLISSFFLFSTAILHATERTTAFHCDSIQYKSGTGAKRCQEMCARKSVPDTRSLLAEGWKVVATSPKEVVAEAFWYTPCSACEPHGCTCVGTESVLEREKPAPVVRIPESELHLLKTENESLKKENAALKQENAPAAKALAPESELDLLKRENESLRRENAALRQENESLRTQMKSRQK